MSMLPTAALSAATLSAAATVALGLATFTFAMPAHAAAPVAPGTFERLEGELPQIRVAYGDLDLSTEQGRHVMRKRLATAAHMVCDEANAITNPLKARAVYNQCREEALDKATTYFAARMKEKQLAQR
jgi:UrcA family protein